MKAQVYFVRRGGIKIPDREAAAVTPLTGELKLDVECVTEYQNFPALALRRNVTSEALWRAFMTREAGIDAGQLVMQDWRCYITQ